ncbi:MAG: hypothetical protein LC674_05550, partial [Actinobacteria bacterium]|nr:hypothetical protein [Actinomycetota bacterium]
LVTSVTLFNWHMSRFALLLISVWVSAVATVQAQQRNDPSFDVRVLAPAHTTRHPRVLIDAAHMNVFSTTTDRVLPLTQLLRADGFDIDIGHGSFTAKNLATAEILVILTATGKTTQEDPAFTPEEIEAVYQWVDNGGAMLFCLDHFPFGPSGRQMAERFGIRVSLGYVADSITSDRWHGDVFSPIYSRTNRGLQDHPITVGRTAAERVEKVEVFGGQSITGPKGSSILFRVAPTAFDGDDRGRPGEGLGDAQALAMTPGKGRLVVTADCSMWTAQLVTLNGKEFQYGMARKDLDNRQFALNTFRWLSRVLK